MNTEQKQLFAKIQNFNLDKPGAEFPFSKRLAKENNWTLEYSNRAIEEYRKFIFLAITAEHIVTPSEQIDVVWHLHLTYTQSYWEDFCPKVLGKPLHHQPSEGGNTENIKYRDLYDRTLASYQEFFQNEPPEDIWSNTENRFGQDLLCKRVNTQKNWIIPKPNISLELSSFWQKQVTLITSIIIGLIVVFGVTFPGWANNTPFHWDFLNTTIDIQDNGDILVTEEQKYVFLGTHSPEHYRFIKLDKQQAIGEVRVFEDGQLVPSKTKLKDDRFWIEWRENNPEQKEHLFTLKYRATGAIENIKGRDSLEWQAIFPKRKGIINSAEVTVNLPEILQDNVTSYYSFGTQTGSQFKSDLIDGKTIRFKSLKQFFPDYYSSIKVTFFGNPLNLEPQKKSASPQGILIGAFIAVWVLVVIIGIVFSAANSNSSGLRKNRGGSNNSSGGCSSFGGCGGSCGGGCGGGG